MAATPEGHSTADKAERARGIARELSGDRFKISPAIAGHGGETRRRANAGKADTRARTKGGVKRAGPAAWSPSPEPPRGGTSTTPGAGPKTTGRAGGGVARAKGKGS